MEPTKKLFTEKQVSASAFFGGPIPPGILIYKNLIRLEKEKEAYLTIAATFLFTTGLIYVVINLPDEVIQNFSKLFPIVIGLIVWALYHFLLADLTKERLAEEGAQESNWTVTGWTFGGIICYLAMVVGIAFFEPPFPGEKMAFDGNEIYFDQTNTSRNEVQKLATQLYSIEYFATETLNVVRLNKQGKKYTVQLPVDKEVWEDSEVIDVIYSLKWLLEADLEAEISIILEHYDLNGQTLTKTI